MTTGSKSTFTADQTSTWLRGLMTIAWSDGKFDPQEQSLIEEVVANELTPDLENDSFKPISPEELTDGLGDNPKVAENFLRTAVMVALADGVYSSSEDQVLETFAQALRVQLTAVDSLRLTLDGEALDGAPKPTEKQPRDPLKPVRQWLDGLDIQDPEVARFLCKMIPSQCPFERDITLFGKKVVHIPPMCKLNPLYEQLVGLRFKALSYLADECKEDVSSYI
ncbi:Mo-dependent nitrogenase C-terminal domain-containing protein [Acaryochloris marina]|uniref:Mo-dependent nitrogenase-like protein n=1 Tax=Acaryochloris marina (strain MBIC 11017) TaxID=329726 RepID=B0C479_ACAM1|nr:Mo-dependent nitrogenase C-terminal domain-containing protein [Acaryochloris marina]ABW27470.1 Mo-dependent nitrogenase-like protein [Acaryochloris marina MBIC11017]BDM82206.1 nitrogenase [Acaryochloris marina MBIC10699]